jgi:hypothetical protein
MVQDHKLDILYGESKQAASQEVIMWPGNTHLLKETLCSTSHHTNYTAPALLVVNLAGGQQALPAILSILNLAA